MWPFFFFFNLTVLLLSTALGELSALLSKSCGSSFLLTNLISSVPSNSSTARTQVCAGSRSVQSPADQVVPKFTAVSLCALWPSKDIWAFSFVFRTKKFLIPLLTRKPGFLQWNQMMFPHLPGLVCLNDWVSALESVMHLGLPWRMLSSQLSTAKSSDGMINYHEWFNELAIKGANIDVRM